MAWREVETSHNKNGRKISQMSLEWRLKRLVK